MQERFCTTDTVDINNIDVCRLTREATADPGFTKEGGAL